MKTFKKVLSGFVIIAGLTSCSVHQFAVNTNVKPFEKGGKIFGEKTKNLEFEKSRDWHVLGFNIKNSNTQKMAEDLNATAFTIETKSNLFIKLITSGMVDYKLVKVIKRAN